MTFERPSPVSEAIEEIVTKTIGAAIRVHRQLGPGLGEGQYEDALAIQLERDGLRFNRQHRVTIHYEGKPLRPQRIDLIVEDQVIVEVKSVERLHPVHRSQVIAYLRATGLRIGLLINFNAPLLKGNIKRVVL